MSDDVVVTSNLHGRLTPTRGRYELRGEGFALISDGSLRSGGPGEAASALDLLVASLVSCALNAFRRDLLVEGAPDREVEIFARVERSPAAPGLGVLIMECFIAQDSEDRIDPDRLVAEYRQRCRIYNALKEDLPVEFVVHPVEDTDW